MAGPVLGVALLAAVVTKLVDLFRQLDSEDSWPKGTWLILSMGFGVAIALIWQVDALKDIGVSHTTRLQGLSGQIITGMLIGGFGSGWHEAFDALSGAAKGGHKQGEGRTS